jgi:hypothetical protein
MPRHLILSVFLAAVASTATTHAFLALGRCKPPGQDRGGRIEAAGVSHGIGAGKLVCGRTRFTLQRRGGITMQLKPSTAPPFTTKEEQEQDKGIKVRDDQTSPVFRHAFTSSRPHS